MSGIFDIPPEPVRGQPVTAEWGIKVVRMLRKLQPRSSDTVGVSVTHSGTTYKAAAAMGGTAEVTIPWTGTNVSSSTEARLAIYPGFVNGEAPTINVSGTPTSILDDPAPYLVLTVSCSIYLKVTVDASDDITAYELIASASSPASTYEPGTGGTAYARLLSVTMASGRIARITPRISGNLLLGIGHGYVWTSV